MTAPVFVCVGSLNPVKIAAVRAVVEHFFPGARVESVAAASGVPAQPFGDEETRRGAANRARAAREARGADFGVGLEGGVVEEADGSLRTCAWAAVATADGRLAFGGSLALTLPPDVAALVRGGLELGAAMDRLSGRVDVKHAEGAAGILTRGFVDRRRAYEPLVAYAFAGLRLGPG
jgi:inosine/xanthosine triphosphatase